MKLIKTVFPCGGLSLEACLELPEVPGPLPGVVICHPHPLYGGNLDNNVVTAVSSALASAGIAGLRFNFRGVGRSQGSYGQGNGEMEDARAALKFLSGREETDPARIGLMGYSFGGMVALGVGGTEDLVKALAAVSPVVPPGPYKELSARPKYIICGEADSIIPAREILSWSGELEGPKKIEVIPGADHFWWGREDDLANRVAGFFKQYL